jgi:hypothetical protein
LHKWPQTSRLTKVQSDWPSTQRRSGHYRFKCSLAPLTHTTQRFKCSLATSTHTAQLVNFPFHSPLVTTTAAHTTITTDLTAQVGAAPQRLSPWHASKKSLYITPSIAFIVSSVTATHGFLVLGWPPSCLGRHHVQAKHCETLIVHFQGLGGSIVATATDTTVATAAVTVAHSTSACPHRLPPS